MKGWDQKGSLGDRLGECVEWIQLAQDRDRLVGSYEYGDESSSSGATEFV
jgi:hypothetical protein